MTQRAAAMNWDLKSYFPCFDGPEMKQFKTDLERDIAAVQKEASGLKPLCRENADEWERLFIKAEGILQRQSHLESYLSCLGSADSKNEAYQREEAALARLGAEFQKLEVELLRGLKPTSDDVFREWIARPSFEGGQYFLQRMREESQRTMTPEKEVLAADLGVDGIEAWGRLYDTVSGRLEFVMEYPDGRRERIPMSQRRSFLDDPDRRVRRAAFEGGNAAWETVETVAAAALNAISGARLTLNRHRGIDHFLEVALFQSAVTRKSIDAMFDAVRSNLEVPRKILQLKARAMGTEGIAWYDLGAPLPLGESRRYSWEEGQRMVQDAFAQAYPALGTYLQRTLDQRWIDWEPRDGKRSGAFCTSSLRTRESRIFMTFQGSLGDVLTLAHETGHAFHHEVLRDIRPWANLYPMTLAESASTFGETILVDGILNSAGISDLQKATILDTETGHGAVYLMDIPVRYEFEKAMHEERASGELSVTRLKELMVETQRTLFGDLLEKGGEDPLFWASKLHFYITGLTFYNFPYTFGYLLSRGLYALFQKEGKDFLPKYEAFLRLTGSDTTVNVVRRSIGADLESPEFWTASIRSLEKPLALLEELLPSIQGTEE